MLKQLFVMMSLTVSVPGCQTTPDKPPQADAAAVLDSQKAIVFNALDSGKPQSALATLRPLLRTYPKDASLHTLMGLTQLALKNPGRAVRHMQTAYKLDKRTSTGLNLSAAYMEAGDYDKANALLLRLRKTAIAESYANPERVCHNLGIVAAKQKRLTKAEEWYRSALEENPTFHPSHLELARLYQETRRPALAIKSYRAALDFCQVCYEPLAALANLYMKSGRYTDARLMLARYVKNESVSPEDKARAEELLRIAASSGLGSRR